jgi:hypothetical protein
VEGAGNTRLFMRALFLSAALISAALSGCVRCCVPLNAPPYDPAQWGWGPQDRFCVTRSYYGFAKDYPGVHPYYMVPPGAPPRLASDTLACSGCGPNGVPVWQAQAPMGGPNVVVGPNSGGPNLNAGANVVFAGPSAVAF